MKKTNKAGVEVEVGSKWEMARYIGGQLAPLRVMGIVDDWVMLRRKHASPLCAHINTFGTEYLPR